MTPDEVKPGVLTCSIAGLLPDGTAFVWFGGSGSYYGFLPPGDWQEGQRYEVAFTLLPPREIPPEALVEITLCDDDLRDDY